MRTAEEKAMREFLAEHGAKTEYLLAGIRDVFTKNGRPVKGALALPVGATANAAALLSNSAGRVVGWALKEATGTAAAEIDLLDGTNVDGDLLAPITLSAGESVRDWFGPSGVSFGRGLYCQIVGGQITGTVWLGRVDL